jgi:RND family efflux transporter MFP subunit
MGPHNHEHSTAGTTTTTTTPHPHQPHGHVGADVAHHAPADEHSSHVPTKYSKRTNGVVLVFALLVAAGLGVAYVTGSHSRAKVAAELRDAADRDADQPPPVNVMHVRRAPVDSLITLPGEARAFYETTLFARTNGYVSKWLVDIGDAVEQGQPLATIDTPELDDQVAAAKSKVEGLKADVKVAQSNADFAKVSYERWAAAAPDGVVSAQERDQKKAELDSSLARLEAAKAQVTIAQGDVQRLQTLTNFKTVVAPFKGTITQRHIDVGALVTAGSTSNTSSLFTVAQSDQVRVFVNVPQAAVADIKVGMPVAAAVREYPGRTFTGKVGRTAESIDPAARTLKVEVLIPNPDHVILPGMFTWVTFKGSRTAPPVEIPAAALCMRPDGPQVAIVDKADHVTFKPITIDRDLGAFIEVSSGLAGDETVALNIGNDVTGGTRIETRLVDSRQEPAPAAAKPKATASAGAANPVIHAVLAKPESH